MFAVVSSVPLTAFLTIILNYIFNILDATNFLLIEQCPICMLILHSSIAVLVDCIISSVLLVFNFMLISMFMPLLHAYQLKCCILNLW